eukprot:scaffold8718_cov159-Isochrysis_galbana.AAC.4
MFSSFGRLEDSSGSDALLTPAFKEIKNIIGFDLASLALRDGTDTAGNHHAVIGALLNRVNTLEVQVANGNAELVALESRLSNLTRKLYGVPELL